MVSDTHKRHFSEVSMEAGLDTPSNVTARSIAQTCVCKDTDEQ